MACWNLVEGTGSGEDRWRAGNRKWAVDKQASEQVRHVVGLIDGKLSQRVPTGRKAALYLFLFHILPSLITHTHTTYT